MSNREVEIAVEVVAESPKALRVFDGKITAWVPRSQITDEGVNKDGTIYSIFIPEWLAIEKGFL